MSGDEGAMEAAWAEFVKARAELEAFDVRWAGVVFKAKGYERRALVDRMADAQRSYAIAMVTPPAEVAHADGQSPRRPGRPPWTALLFDERWAAAAAEADATDLGAVAAHFKALDGTTGMDPEALRKLRRRRELGKLK